ncbi:hypothetical protein TURU_091033 [Turdus rufiventris]|nr:hypothetical protein TURU_091033 [Turdus rufiventris]
MLLPVIRTGVCGKVTVPVEEKNWFGTERGCPKKVEGHFFNDVAKLVRGKREKPLDQQILQEQQNITFYFLWEVQKPVSLAAAACKKEGSTVDGDRGGKPREEEDNFCPLLPLFENSFPIMSFGKSDVVLRAKSDRSQIKGRFALTSLEIVSSP